MNVRSPANGARGILKKLKLELPHDPAVLRLSAYSKEMESGSRGDLHPMFTAAGFPVTEIWKHLSVYNCSGWCSCLLLFHLCSELT